MCSNCSGNYKNPDLTNSIGDSFESWNSFRRHETDMSKSRFEKWADKVEKILGHDLDGDQEQDGYSLDFAFEEFERGVSPERYVASVKQGQVVEAHVNLKGEMLMANVTVTVNGKDVKEFIGREKSREIQDFLRDEMRFFGRTRYMKFGHTSISNNRSKVEQTGGGSIRCK